VLISTHVARIEVQSDQLAIELTNAKGIGSKRSRSRNMLKVSWHKTPLRRRRAILVPGSSLQALSLSQCDSIKQCPYGSVWRETATMLGSERGGGLLLNFC
jgi:hypothetical protein